MRSAGNNLNYFSLSLISIFNKKIGIGEGLSAVAALIYATGS